MVNPPPRLQLSPDCTADEVKRLTQFLEEQGTFRFPTLANGLFSAAAGEGGDFELTGYRNVWVRDNVHIAHAHWTWGETEKAAAATRSLMTYFEKHRHRFSDIIDGKTDPRDPMARPHIRFDGDRLCELDEKWSHAQNDAIGGFLWLASRLGNVCQWNPKQQNLLDMIARYLLAIEFWEDEDSGHWEEVRKVSASSIGVATAGLEAWSEYSGKSYPARGREALQTILPRECIQPDPLKNRPYDAALLFLIFPYQLVSNEMADQIVADVTTNLLGPYGIRRYIGDSYWCANYKEKLAATVRTADFSDNLADRDRLLEPGTEAQWCLFDPILSIYYGQRSQRTGEKDARQRQIEHLNRALGQLTSEGSSSGPYRCPESYYSDQGKYVPNDICPLLWTQANLKMALRAMMAEPGAAGGTN
ncbi:glycoside hydrolase family 15 protein [Schlesneria sp. DSM 10557]|uniref:glycoside hydrolase family 15 protein n=1 Tax=Schlesneria sp. DSM 10557 TaxID=3044399 RepID=UPI00359F8B0A